MLRTAWSLFMVIALVLTVASLPIEIAFYSTEQLTEDTEDIAEVYYSRFIAIITAVIFSVDIVINFRTGYVLKQTDEVYLNGVYDVSPRTFPPGIDDKRCLDRSSTDETSSY